MVERLEIEIYGGVGLAWSAPTSCMYEAKQKKNKIGYNRAKRKLVLMLYYDT